MAVRTWKHLLAGVLACAVLAPASVAADGQSGRGRTPEIFQRDYERGYREGLRRGQDDAADGRPFDAGNSVLRSRYRDGFLDGYRLGYERRYWFSPASGARRSAPEYWQRQGRGHREPAFAAGYDDGFTKGLGDGSDGSRYDPVRHVEYRDAERGYRESYGSREAYRTNYRAGFRQGYEDGYRKGTRNRQ